MAHLRQRRTRRGELAQLAGKVGVSVRTLYTWRSRGGALGRPGRKPRVALGYAEARALCEPLWRELVGGHDGARTLRACLERAGQALSMREIERVVRELKAERKARERERVRAERQSVKVLVRDALWALDQTQVGRDARGPICALEVCEAWGPRVLAVSVGRPARGQEVLALLEQAAQERGGYPLVLQMDNGPENRNTLVEQALCERQVIVLWNQPHTPQHNAGVERMHGALKRASGLAASRWPDSRVVCALRLAEASRQLNGCTPRARLGGRTPDELDRIGARAETCVRRGDFFAQLQRKLTSLAHDAPGARARRRLEREAIYSALEDHHLIIRTRGGQPVRALKSEVNA